MSLFWLRRISDQLSTEPQFLINYNVSSKNIKFTFPESTDFYVHWTKRQKEYFKTDITELYSATYDEEDMSVYGMVSDDSVAALYWEVKPESVTEAEHHYFTSERKEVKITGNLYELDTIEFYDSNRFIYNIEPSTFGFSSADLSFDTALIDPSIFTLSSGVLYPLNQKINILPITFRLFSSDLEQATPYEDLEVKPFMLVSSPLIYLTYKHDVDFDPYTLISGDLNWFCVDQFECLIDIPNDDIVAIYAMTEDDVAEITVEKEGCT